MSRRDSVQDIRTELATIIQGMTQTIYRVAVDCVRCTMGPHRISVLVLAEDGHEALDRATEHPNANRLYDEEIQRAIVDGEIDEGRVERKYDGYIESLTIAGATV